MKISRRNALAKIGTLAGTPALLGISGSVWQGDSPEKTKTDAKLKGRVQHSVCRWPYGSVSLEKLCEASVEMGIQSVEIVGPDEWPVLKEYGLTCAMPRYGDIGIENGFSNPELHERLIQSFKESIPKVAEAGYDKVICFSGNRNGMDDETGLRNCVEGIKPIIEIAEEYDVILTMELLNSKVNHPDYFCDKTAWGVELCDRIDSDHFKLLYDIYHMQVMEGDIIQTIRDYHEYFSHYHTGGVPGRNEIDDTQELYYPAIMEAIVETGYKGFVGQEFVPTWSDPLAALKQSIEICDV